MLGHAAGRWLRHGLRWWGSIHVNDRLWRGLRSLLLLLLGGGRRLLGRLGCLNLRARAGRWWWRRCRTERCRRWVLRGRSVRRALELVPPLGQKLHTLRRCGRR